MRTRLSWALSVLGVLVALLGLTRHDPARTRQPVLDRAAPDRHRRHRDRHGAQGHHVGRRAGRRARRGAGPQARVRRPRQQRRRRRTTSARPSGSRSPASRRRGTSGPARSRAGPTCRVRRPRSTGGSPSRPVSAAPASAPSCPTRRSRSRSCRSARRNLSGVEVTLAYGIKGGFFKGIGLLLLGAGGRLVGLVDPRRRRVASGPTTRRPISRKKSSTCSSTRTASSTRSRPRRPRSTTSSRSRRDRRGRAAECGRWTEPTSDRNSSPNRARASPSRATPTRIPGR